MKFDRYTVFARLFPAALSGIPFFILSYYYLTPAAAELIQEISSFKLAGDFTITTASIFLLMQINRWFSKSFFEHRLFAKGGNFPTTNYILHLNSYFSVEYTKQIHSKILSDFNINLAKSTEEKRDEANARKKISEAVSLIRSKVASGRLICQHNIEYGFARNLAGGAIVGLAVSLINIAVFIFLTSIPIAISASLITGFLYAAFLIFADKLIVALGENYARVLLQEYMAR